MEINKHNYEEYFLLYTDNELNTIQREAVERFVDENPGLKEELDGLLQARVSFDITAPAFDKSFLYKNVDANDEVALTTDEAQLLMYVDNELTDEERKAVEILAEENESVKKQLNLLQRTVLSTNEKITFPDKSLLYKKEEKRVVPMISQWRRVVAAASIILVGGLVWMNMDAIKKPFEQTGSSSLATTNIDSKNVEPKAVDEPAIKEETPVVKSANKLIDNSKDEQVVQQSLAKHNKASTNGKEMKQSNPENKMASDAQERTVAVASANEKLEDGNKRNSITPVTTPTTELIIAHSKIEEAPVKPFKISQAAFNGDDDKDKTTEENINTNKEGVAFLDTDQPGEKSKGNFRGLVRKASRFINRKADSKQEDDSVIRIASFAIAKK